MPTKKQLGQRWNSEFQLNKMEKINIEKQINVIPEEFTPVKVLQDESGHWYAIPFTMFLDFLVDMENEDIADSGEFDKKYSQYRTGGDINNVKLYIKHNP